MVIINSGIDNFSQFKSEEGNWQILKKNLGKFGNPPNVEFYLMEYKKFIKELFLKEPKLKVNIYFYDGPHYFKEQYEGLKIMLPHLTKKCIIIVDDLNWSSVEEANNKFLTENQDFKSAFKIKTKKIIGKYPLPGHCGKTWWNGFEIITRGI